MKKVLFATTFAAPFLLGGAPTAFAGDHHRHQGAQCVSWKSLSRGICAVRCTADAQHCWATNGEPVVRVMYHGQIYVVPAHRVDEDERTVTIYPPRHFDETVVDLDD